MWSAICLWYLFLTLSRNSGSLLTLQFQRKLSAKNAWLKCGTALDMFSCEYVRKLILIFNFTGCASKVLVKLSYWLEMASCSRIFSTAVLSAILDSYDEDLFVKNIGFMSSFCWERKFLYLHTERNVCITRSVTSQSKMAQCFSFFR